MITDTYGTRSFCTIITSCSLDLPLLVWQHFKSFEHYFYGKRYSCRTVCTKTFTIKYALSSCSDKNLPA